MKVYTATICSDGVNEKWAIIENRPPTEHRLHNEYTRHRYVRKGIVVTAIITDRLITEQETAQILAQAFDNPHLWQHVDLWSRDV